MTGAGGLARTPPRTTGRKKTVDVEDQAVERGGRGAIPKINYERARVVASKMWDVFIQRLDGHQKMKEKNDQEKKVECNNLKKGEGVCENCEKEVKNNQDGFQSLWNLSSRNRVTPVSIQDGV